MDSDELIWGWKACAAIAAMSVRRLRDIAQARNLVEKKRQHDNAVGIRSSFLQALKLEFGKVEPDQILLQHEQSVPSQDCRNSNAEPTDSVPSKGFSSEPHLEQNTSALALLRLQVEAQAGLAETNAIALSDVIDQCDRHEGLIERAFVEVRNETATMRQLQAVFAELHQWRAQAESRMADLESRFRSFPAAPMATDCQCPACGIKSVTVPSSCFVCGYGSGLGA
ncbi:MAG: hypothetical protein SGI86_06030 [Deltaproteobacteria bacterium]|nr:hypothetical protein [Deltaproteobacteria bacterium]